MLAHPRSGSTTISSIFASHELISILNEPFNPSRGPDGWGFDFLNYLEEHPLDEILELISNHCNGVKHLVGQLNFDDDMRIFRSFQSRFLICRRNLLQSAVSCKIASQTNQWHRSGVPQVSGMQLDPIPLEEVDSLLQQILSNDSRTREIIQQERLNCTEIVYEEIFDQSIGLGERVDKCLELVRPFVHSMFSRDYPFIIAKLLDHGPNKVNSEETYRMIPNCDEIHRNLSSDQTGHLFND